MRTNQEIISSIELEYQNKRRRNEINLQKRKRKLYEQYPYLEKIDDEINMKYLSIVKDSIEEKNVNNKTYKDIDELKKQKKQYILENNIDMSSIKMNYECNICKDTGVLENNGKISRCQCYINRYNSLVYENMNMSKLFEDCNFDKFDIEIFDDVKKIGKFTQREFMSKMRNKALSFIDNFDDKNEKSMLFYGQVGVGKSYLCLCIAEKLIKKRKNVVYESSSELFEKLARYVFSSDKTQNSDAAVFNSLVYNCDLLIIDDLGSEMTNDFVRNQMFSIVNIRAVNGRKTIISSNLTQDELQERYEQRTFSRISSYYNTYKFIGRDLRMPKLQIK